MRQPPQTGILILDLVELPESTPGDGLDLIPGDILLTCNDITYKSIASLIVAVSWSAGSNQPVALKVYRDGMQLAFQCTAMELLFAMGRIDGRYVRSVQDHKRPTTKPRRKKQVEDF